MGQPHHALIVDFHQPSGHLEQLLSDDPWSAKEILYALDRVPRCLWDHADLARVHLSLSGTLLETLSSPGFQERVYGIVKLGDLLWFLQNEAIFEVLGSAYYHPILPLCSEADRKEHVSRWLGIGRHLMGRDHVAGFWPPELAFEMELIPLLKAFGYRYVVVDSARVEALTPMSEGERLYLPHTAEHGGESITVVVRDRELSKAQHAGCDAGWFERAVADRTTSLDAAPLVTTATPGDDGGWFRNVRENFWTKFYLPFLHRHREGRHDILPVHLDRYLDDHPSRGRVRITPGAWNHGLDAGDDLHLWSTGPGRSRLLARGRDLGARLASLTASNAALLEQARWRLLRSQTSCHLAWGGSWLDRAHQDLSDAEAWIERLEGRAPEPGGDVP